MYIRWPRAIENRSSVLNIEPIKIFYINFNINNNKLYMQCLYM